MAGIVNIPWYATLFRGDRFEVAVQEIAPVALRYGASEYSVYRSRDDAYRFLQLATFEDKSRLRSLLVRRGVLDLARRLLELVPGARRLHLGRSGDPRRDRRAGADHPCSSGAIVSPESFSSSQ